MHLRALDTKLRQLGTTLVQWDALRAIGNLAGGSGHDLALATFQTDQAFGTLANRLEAQGLIVRRPGRGRRVEHHLTSKGERLFADGHQVVREGLTELFAGLTESDRARLLDLISRVGTGDEPDPLGRPA
jgi:DNA-binding MarR family transcriptional regulator